MNRPIFTLCFALLVTASWGCQPPHGQSPDSSPTPPEPAPAALVETVEPQAPATSPTAVATTQPTVAPTTQPTAAAPSPTLAPDATRLGLVGPAPRNVILLIGDGMGPVHETAGSHYVHGADGMLRMQQAPYRTQVATRCADEEITDSAAAATAMSTGVHVNYEVVALALPGDGSPLPTVLEQFQASGRPVGMVTTSRLTHATPASYAAHVPVRYEERDIAEQLLEEPLVTLMFGGGGRGMTPRALRNAGYAVATDADSLAALPADAERWATVVGDSHLPYIADGRGDAPDLPSMTARALALLAPRGSFFLMVEGARIDHASHNNHIARMLPEVAEFDETLSTVLAWAEGRDDTLVMLTADHECGGLSITEHAPAGELPDVTWSTGGHTAADVNLYAWGPFGQVIENARDNRDLYWFSRWPLGVAVENLEGTPFASE